MKKERIQIEYTFDNVSHRSLWNHIATPAGLSAWFADDVAFDENTVTFRWKKTSEQAVILSIEPENSIRMRWVDEEPYTRFGFTIRTAELTGATTLAITDFADPDERHDTIALWDSQVETLKRTLGI